MTLRRNRNCPHPIATTASVFIRRCFIATSSMGRVQLAAGGFNQEPAINPNSRLVLADANSLVDAMHALEIPGGEPEREEAEHIPSQAGVVTRVGDDDYQIRRNGRIRHNAS